MKKMLLATVATAALIAGPAIAQRQEAPASKSEAPASAPAPMQKAPAEKVAPPPGKAMPDGAENRAPERSTTGQASPTDKPSGEIKRGSETKPGDRSTTGQSAPTGKPSGDIKAGSDTKPGATTDSKPGADTKSPRASGTDTKQAPSTAQGQGQQSGGSVALTTEQKSKIRTSVLTTNAPRATNVNFSVNIGTVVPRSVRLVTVPAPLIEIHPAWRGFLYFVYDDRIVIVEPGTLRIVTIIEV